MKFFVVVLSSLILVACGGGGSSPSDSPTAGPSPSDSPTACLSPSDSPPPGPPPPSLANEALKKYEGVWREACDLKYHMRVTKTSTATGSNTFSVVTREDYYDNADCTGALVATGSYGKADENVEYKETLPNASVTFPTTGETIESNVVDPATSRLEIAPFTFTGCRVASEYIGGTTHATITYADGTFVSILRPAINGIPTYGAFLLWEDELLTLEPIDDSTTSFKVYHRYTR